MPTTSNLCVCLLPEAWNALRSGCRSHGSCAGSSAAGCRSHGSCGGFSAAGCRSHVGQGLPPRPIRYDPYQWSTSPPDSLPGCGKRLPCGDQRARLPSGEISGKSSSTDCSCHADDAHPSLQVSGTLLRRETGQRRAGLPKSDSVRWIARLLRSYQAGEQRRVEWGCPSIGQQNTTDRFLGTDAPTFAGTGR